MLTWASDFTLVDVFDSHIKEVLVSLQNLLGHIYTGHFLILFAR